MIHNGNFNVHTQALDQGILENPDWQLHLPGHEVVIRDLADSADEVIRVDFQYRRLKVISCDDQRQCVSLDGGTVLHGSSMCQLLHDCESAVLAAFNVKTGPNESTTLEALKRFQSLLRVSSKRVRDDILKTFNLQTSQLTQRFTPGYCGWPEEEQVVVLGQLQQSGLTSAEKQLSPHIEPAIFGIRKQSHFKPEMPCYNCTSVTCILHHDFNLELKNME